MERPRAGGESSDAQERPSASRRRAVKRVLKQWRSQLIDISGSNRLLYYVDRKVATVDLSDASASGLAELFSGSPTRVSRLWPDGAALIGVVRSLKAIAKPARVYAEEFGLQTTFVASGFATWDVADGGKKPCAPVLLRQLTFRALPGSLDGFELDAAEDVQVNPVLVHFLEAEYGVAVDDVELLELADADEAILFERLTKICGSDLPGFVVENRRVIANFAYASQSMVADLDDENIDFLAAHDMIAALAGDAEASDLVRVHGEDVSFDAPDTCAPSDEHLILDADGSQSYVINAIAAGQHLVVQGPPGTGKTQTITNAIADLVARGKTVLFVAQKRAAIIAVLDRLRAVDLDGIVLDLFDGASSRKAVVQELGRSIERASVTGRPRVDALHQAYGAARDLLVAHRSAMHQVRDPWGMSLLGSKEDGDCVDGFYDWAAWTADQQTDVRLSISDLQKWDVNTHDRLRREMEDLFAAGGLDADLLTRPGWSVVGLSSNESLSLAEEIVSRLLDIELSGVLDSLRELIGESGIAQPERLTTDWSRRFVDAVSALHELHLAGFGPLVRPSLETDVLKDFVDATADRTERKAHGSQLGLMARRKARKQLAEHVPSVHGSAAHGVVVRASQARDAWKSVAGVALPDDPSPLWEAARSTLAAAETSLRELSKYVQGLAFDDFSSARAELESLRSDRRRRAFPRIHGLRASITSSGCEVVLNDLGASPEADGDAAANRLSHAFACSVIEHVDKADDRLAGYSSADLNRATDALMSADEKLREANVSRVRRAAAERLIAALDAHPQQAEAVRGQVKRKRGFQPVRRLVDELAPDVILASKPVWAASPQIVSQLLPARVLFDVVLFDEASQVLPAAALPSIARGRQVVVAGDDLQLPPTTVFTRTSELEVDESMDLDALEPDDESSSDEQDQDGTNRSLVEIPDTESILDALGVKLGTQRSRYLAWHYRSRDEKLIATSNTFIYRPRGRMMTTFPAADSSDALSHIRCEPSVGLGKTNMSPTGEVTRVVELMLSHAAEQSSSERPLSLGVIAFGAKHAARIERQLEERLGQSSDEIQGFFSRETHESYFVKNIERVQGDERDVILLTVGYGRGTDGRLRYNWGPVLTEGGHRRVNVAITRARERMTLVTSFDPADVDAGASTAEGFSLMNRFLRYSASAGTDFGDEGATHVPSNPFEADIQARMEERGLVVVPQWGAGGYRLDFAVQHPDLPGRFLLAVEADGASYHSGTVARERDRLRQRQLEARGWRFVRIWSSDYFFDADSEIDRVMAAYEEELARSFGRKPRRRRIAAGGAAKAPEASEPDDEVPDWEEPIPVRHARPVVPFGPPIQQYSDRQLEQMVSWVISDDLPRTRADVYETVKAELGFQRDGKVIRERILDAVEEVMGAL